MKPVKSYFRVMLGQKSIYAAECFAGSFIGTDFGIDQDLSPKDVQAMMRHSRISTTLDIYAQFVPDSQRRAIEQTSKMAAGRIANAQAARAVAASGMLN
jgi:hypothetical protein